MSSYTDWLDEISTENIENLFANAPWLVAKIRQRRVDSVIFKTGICLAVYLLAKNHPTEFPNAWPLDIGLLNYVYTDIGIAPTW